jgi:Tfp pilus assembly protein PilF
LQEQLGLLFMSKGDLTVAESHFIKAINLNEDMESSRKMLAIIYMSEPNWEKTLGIMQAAANKGSRDAFFWKNIGFLQKYYKANFKEAGKAWNRYFALGGDSYDKRIREEMQSLTEK